VGKEGVGCVPVEAGPVEECGGCVSVLVADDHTHFGTAPEANLFLWVYLFISK
jgi:hypothetical protein